VDSIDVGCGDCGYICFRVIIHRRIEIDFKCPVCGTVGSVVLEAQKKVASG
jgi:uncharacterized Zn finger protein